MKVRDVMTRAATLVRGSIPRTSRTIRSNPRSLAAARIRVAVFDHRKKDGTEETRDRVGEVTQRISPGPT